MVVYIFSGYTCTHGNELFILDLECSNDVFNIDDKCLKKTETSTNFMWHCRLVHIEMNRADKIHNDEVL